MPQDIKEHLVNLILEQYKQQCLFQELEDIRISLADVCVNNLDIVMDMIGFPEDPNILNRRDDADEGEVDALDEYSDEPVDENPEQGEIEETEQEAAEEEEKYEDGFERSPLHDRYYTIFEQLSMEQKITVTEHGLQFEEGANTEIVRAELMEYVEWLYAVLDNWKSGDYK